MKPENHKRKSPIAWVPTVYFAMGLPMVLISDVSLLMFKDLGIGDAQIAFWSSLLVLPWSLKPFWSPFMEIFGSKKQYVIFTEFISAVALGLIAASLGMDLFFATSIVLMLFMAISGSVHDIAGDGTYMHYLDDVQQSQYIGWQGAFYNLAKILAKGGLVYLVGVLSSHIGILRSWQLVMVIAGVLLGGVGFYHLLSLPGKMENSQSKPQFQQVLQELLNVIRTFFQKKHIWYYMLFILLYRLTEGLATKIAPLFLTADRAVGGLGMTNEQYGLIYGTGGTIAFIIGSILSGYYISHYGLKRVLLSLALIFNIPFVVYFMLAYYLPTQIAYPTVGIILEFFGYGFGFVGINLFMMQQVAPGPHRMAHYAIGTSLMNLSVMIPGMLSGIISEYLGYQHFFLLALILCLPGLICTGFVPFTYPSKTTE